MVIKQFEPKKIYIRVNAQPITTSGIYHNSDLGLISLSSNGSNWITIADKNMGATTVWSGGDTLTDANCGYFYQWGNNYGFPHSGNVTTSSTQVNASNYGPGNYYSSSTFITRSSSPYDRSNVQNDNLWGGTTGTNEAMQGPCPSGFHIPTNTEWSTIKTIWTSLGGGSSDGSGFSVSTKIPLAGYRSNQSGASAQGSEGLYSSSIRNGASYIYVARITSTVLNLPQSQFPCYGISIRPFKNDAVQPDDSRTKLY